MIQIDLLSPSLIRDYITCPRSFMFIHLLKLNLIPSTQFNKIIYAQERIENFTTAFFSSLKSQWNEEVCLKSRKEMDYLLKTKFYSFLDIYHHSDSALSQELDEKVFTLLLWLISKIWIDLTPQEKLKPYFLPIMTNQYIKVPELNLHGRPSALFIHPDDTALLLIQTYYPTISNMLNFLKLQVAIYSRILESYGVRVRDFMYINYFSMVLIMQGFSPESEYEQLDKFLDSFQSSMIEQDYEPPKNPPCDLCEFRMICTN